MGFMTEMGRQVRKMRMIAQKCVWSAVVNNPAGRSTFRQGISLQSWIAVVKS